MPKVAISEKIKELAEALVFAEVDDIQALATLHTLFDEFTNLLSKKTQSYAVDAAVAASKIVEDLVLGDAGDPSAAIECISKTISCLELLLCEGYKDSDITFPKELNIFPKEKTSAKKKATKKDKAVKEASKKDTLKDDALPENKDEQECLKEPEVEASEEAASLSSPGQPATDTSDDENINASIIENYIAAINMDAALVADFIAESNEHLDASDGNLLTLEATPEDVDTINAVFRAFHTIKGVASFLNLNEIRTLSHSAENVLDKARSNEVVLKDEVMDVIFESVDCLKAMINDLSTSITEGIPQSNISDYSQLMKRLDLVNAGEIAGPESTQVEVKEPEPVAAKSPETAVDTIEEFSSDLPYEIIITEAPKFIEESEGHLESLNENLLQVEKHPDSTELLNGIFRSFHTIKGSAGFLGLLCFERLAHHAESLLDLARKKELTLGGEPLDATFEAVDVLRHMFSHLKQSLKTGEIKYAPSNLDAVIARLDKCSSPNSDEPQESSSQDKPDSSAKPAEAVKVEAVKVEASSPAPQPTSIPKAAPEKQLSTGIKKAVVKEVLKVDADRLNKLVDMIGELVIAETMVVQSDELRSSVSKNMLQNFAHLDKITRELQSMGTSLRMIPIHSTFQKMARLARDLSKKVNKDVEFVMKGEETELDKTVVDAIGDPLVHMVRNSIDHGIELTAEDRIAAGKPAKARVELRAYHKGGSIYIEIEDDGRGLNHDAIINKAIENQIITSADGMSESEINQLIFAPGFSTAAEVTEVSGRGVGMDVVKRNIEALRGQIDITSRPGLGSVFSIRLPLTLAIIDGMVVSSCNENYIIPTLSILMSVNVHKKDLKTVQGKGEVLKLQDELIPVFHLEKLFEFSDVDSNQDEFLIAIVEDGGKKTGVVIDEILGQQQIVIKSLGEYLQNIDGISGSAIMADGTVGLILDIGGLVKLANS